MDEAIPWRPIPDKGSPLTFTPATGDWHIAFESADRTDRWGVPIVGWSVVVRAVFAEDDDGGYTTGIEPIFTCEDRYLVTLSRYLNDFDKDKWKMQVCIRPGRYIADKADEYREAAECPGLDPDVRALYLRMAGEMDAAVARARDAVIAAARAWRGRDVYGMDSREGALAEAVDALDEAESHPA